MEAGSGNAIQPSSQMVCRPRPRGHRHRKFTRTSSRRHKRLPHSAHSSRAADRIARDTRHRPDYRDLSTGGQRGRHATGPTEHWPSVTRPQRARISTSSVPPGHRTPQRDIQRAPAAAAASAHVPRPAAGTASRRSTGGAHSTQRNRHSGRGWIPAGLCRIRGAPVPPAAADTRARARCGRLRQTSGLEHRRRAVCRPAWRRRGARPDGSAGTGLTDPGSDRQSQIYALSPPQSNKIRL